MNKSMEPEFVFPKDPIFDFMIPTKKKVIFIYISFCV